MRRFTNSFIHLTIILLSFIVLSGLHARSQDDQGTLTKDNIRTEADNIGYWMEAARLGIVPYNQPVMVKPGQPIPSRSGAKSIEQMTTDVMYP